jgi:hypothetical protein
MSMRFWTALAVGAALAGVGSVHAEPAAPLPLHKVRLYESGVGYFERTGPLPPGGVGLPVPLGHLDDALKTLVILDADGGATVSGISFSSTVTRELGRALAGLPEGDETPLSLPRLIQSLTGAEVEIRLATEAVRGRIVALVDGESSGVERCLEGTARRDEGCELRQEPTVVVLTPSGELRRLVVRDVTGVRPLDAATRGRIAAALDATTDRGARADRWLHVAAAGARSITLGYVAEAPVWRSTYRLVLAKEGAATLQGWALVHNDTEEPWRQVRLELVNGQPDSFLFPLAAPRYERRPFVAPERALSSIPQLLDTTVDGMLWADEIGEAFGAGGLGLIGVGEGGGGRGEGIGLGSIGVSGSSETSSSLVTVGNLAALAPAEGTESGALFEYALATPLDLAPRASAIVPFLAGSLDAKRIAWFDAAGATARAAVHLVNTTRQTLPAGTLAVFADGGFVGESLIARTKPREERILRFGADLDVELTEAERAESREPRAVQFDAERDELIEHYRSRQEIRYSLVNRSGSARVVYLDLDYQDNAQVTGAERLAYDPERNQAQAVFSIGPHATAEEVLVVELGQFERISWSSVSSAWLEQQASCATIGAAERKALRAILAARQRLAEGVAEVRSLRSQLVARTGDLERLRDSVGALGAARSKATRRLAARIERTESDLVALEDSLRAALAEVKRLSTVLRAAKRELPSPRGLRGG